MPSKNDKANESPDAIKHFPDFDMDKFVAGQYAGDELVYAERFSTSGAIMRIRGAVKDVAPFIYDFETQFKLTDKITAARARSELHRRAFEDGKARGNIPEDAEYVPINWDDKRINLTNAEVYGG